MKFFKLIVVLLITLIFSYSTYGLFNSWQGNYFEHASFLTSGLFLIGFIVLFYACYKAIRDVWKLSVIMIIITASGSNYAKANQQVLLSNDAIITPYNKQHNKPKTMF